ncbi:GNAT family N-acetyltransferase [Pseudorhodobacter turbinis]|nr:GNAT family N-acetyltransferase [Pseudorhodobacter turbinis]
MLSQGDIDGAMALSVEAGWNQTADDWRLFLRHGTVFGIIEDGALSASAAIMPYGTEIAWISMVLTRKSRRGCGLGTRLLKHCISVVEAEGRTALLDATPAGEVIYRKLGFEGHETFTRWAGTGGGKSPSGAVAPDIPAAITAANQVFGADRTELLANFASRCPDLCRYDPDTGLCAFGRDGSLATQIGPVVGSSPNPDSPGTEALVAALIGGITGSVFMDVADHCTRLAACLAALGFEKQRPFLRMKRGPWLPPGNGSTVAAIAGPEFG